MLYTKCILSPKEFSDGIRISVMSRHTLNDGKTPDERIQKSFYDMHDPLFGPPSGLIGSYCRKEISFDSFQMGYLAYLENPFIYLKIKALVLHAISYDVSLLGIESSPERCHRRLLAERCRELFPELEILIR